MIVKDEVHVIRDTLAHLLMVFPITYWVIDDTGSTDGTQDAIRAFFAERGIPGELFETPWRNFGYNRSQAFAHAHGKTDYVLVWDADDSVVGTIRLPMPLTADSYPLQFGDENGFRYQRAQIFNNRKRWHYVGVLHEYAACLDAGVTHGKTITGDYYCVSGKSGNRSKDPEKYKKDAAVLEQGLLEEPTNARYAFYCANSYKDAGDAENAIRMYKRVLTMNGWAEEKYIACVRIYDLSGCAANLHYLVESHRHCPSRVEGILRLVRHYTNANMDDVALAYYSLIQEFYETRYDPADIARHLFVAQTEFDFFLPFAVIIPAIRQKRFDLAITMFDKIFQFGYTGADDGWYTCLFSNLSFVVSHIKPDLAFLNRMLAFRAALPPSIPTTAVAAIIARHRDLLSAPLTDETPCLMIQNHAAPRVLLTITTCKRLDLFRQTMNSILRTWTDLDAVDSFFCVDDNSSEEDRAAMRSAYPFFEFYMKTPAEKGHRMSMNIIWDRLQRVKPDFWIHLEDDWLFFRRGSYVREPIRILERTNVNVHQLLYNRNYAELYSDWDINGGSLLEPGVLLHQKGGTVSGKNCAYWPHYSFRPSVIRVAPILGLGNFDSANTFFERDYADRWFAAGFRSAFFNDIRCLHIGRLTTDSGPGSVNAYTLNGTDQFAMASATRIKTWVVNLKRRPDRREAVTACLTVADISGFEFFDAVDGMELSTTPEIAHLFAGNDFGNRRSFIGCALSHYRLWQQLVTDDSADMYLIHEDDITVVPKFKSKLSRLMNDFRTTRGDILFLGRSVFGAHRMEGTPALCALEKQSFVGGMFGYILTKDGARKLLEFIRGNGIRHGIDYVIKIQPETFKPMMVEPPIVLSEWVRPGSSATVDSDIQRDFECLDLSAGEWVFFPGVDHIGDDSMAVGKKPIVDLIQIASKHRAVNTLGFVKNAVKFPLVSSRWFGPRDGLFVRKPRVMLLGFWGDPSCLRNEFEEQSSATSTALTLTDNKEMTDFWVVLGKPSLNASFDPARTLTFHLEPWCGESWQKWGVKTWGEWSSPDPTKFFHVQTARLAPTPAFWQLTRTPVDQIVCLKRAEIACILSEKNADPGQIHRVKFLKYLEAYHADLPVAVFGRENYHNLAAYRGPVTGPKEDILLPTKYYFMCENNSERNYVTEKLWEPILCESLCFYWGAPNVAEIVDPAAYIQLDMSDYEVAARTIREAIANDEWSRRLPAIRAAKQKLLKEQALFAIVERVLREKGIVP